MKRCKKCSARVSKDIRVCATCGGTKFKPIKKKTVRVRVCKKCSSRVMKGIKTCPTCGKTKFKTITEEVY